MERRFFGGSSSGEEFEAHEDGQELCGRQDEAAGLGRPRGAFRPLVGRLMGNEGVVDAGGIVEDVGCLMVAVRGRSVSACAVGGHWGSDGRGQLCKEKMETG